jgi:hypothetical protein
MSIMDQTIRNIKTQEGVEQPIVVRESTKLVCLNFKVPLSFRHRFKIYAAERHITMTEVLLEALESLMIWDTDKQVPGPGSSPAHNVPASGRPTS